MNKISVVVNTFNEEKNIKRCLESLKWADEIVIVDMHSTDHTIDIAKNFTKNIYSYKNTGYVEPARNFAISKAKGDWIFIVDADEEISSALSKKLSEIASKDSYDFVKIPRKNIIFGKWMKHTGWWPDYLIRFFKKGSVTWKDTIHSVPEARGRDINLSEEYAIVHYNYDSVLQFVLKDLASYAKVEAEEKIKNNYVFDYKDAVRFPLQEFLRRYFYQQGYKDGLHGLMLSFLMAFYHFLIFAYIWEKNGFKEDGTSEFLASTNEEFKKAGKEFNYWIVRSNIENIKNPIIRNLARIKRKMKIG